MSEEKRQQVIALGRLGWPLRRIQQETGIRRETAGAYLKAAGIAIRAPGGWGRRAPAKPANEVAPDPAIAAAAELHEQAFRRLGGACRTVVLDNLSEGVLKPDIYDPALNPLYRDMLTHYGAVALPCRVADPDRKAYVSYCTSSRLCKGENRLCGPTAALAL